MADQLPRLYDEFASWFHLLTPPAEYAAEAEYYRQILNEASASPPRTLLELGSGGGNMASHYKAWFQSTLVDPSPGMLALSRTINPECEHLQGDMRTVRLGRTFDAVFVHDAVCYMITIEDLQQAIVTAFVHCRPGGIAIFVPDYVRESFSPGTDHGGEDGDGRALRYLEWTTDPDPTDTIYQVDYAYLFHASGQPVASAYDQHIEGLFSKADWLRLFEVAGFRATAQPDLVEGGPEGYTMFVAVRPEDDTE